MLSHELRNPLSPILTALQLMRLKNQSSREQDVIERQVRTLMRLVEDLLDVSRITLGKIELRKERLEFAEVAARAIEMSSPLLYPFAGRNGPRAQRKARAKGVNSSSSWLTLASQ